MDTMNDDSEQGLTSALSAQAEAPAQDYMEQTLPIDCLNLEVVLQVRGKPNQKVINNYARKKRDAVQFPKPVAFFDGQTKWLADGLHRIGADRKLDRTEVEVEVRPGTKRDAILYAVGANTK